MQTEGSDAGVLPSSLFNDANLKALRATDNEAGRNVLNLMNQASFSPPPETPLPPRNLSTILETDEEADAEAAGVDGQIGSSGRREGVDIERSTFQTPPLPEAEGNLNAEEAELDRQLAAFEPSEGADIETEDKLWRERVYNGFASEFRFYEGDEEIPKGSMNPFDGSLPRIRRWRGRKRSPEVSPNMKFVEDEESDGDLGEMPFQ